VIERRGRRRGPRRVSVGEAADLLDISKNAVITRVGHGTLRSEKSHDQLVRVWLGAALDSGRNTVLPRARVDASLGGTAKDIEQLLRQVHHLREVLAEERGVGGREERIIAQLTKANALLSPLAPELKTRDPVGRLAVGLRASVQRGVGAPLLMEKVLRWWKGKRLPHTLERQICRLQQQVVLVVCRGV
jgi:hypothetical protein